jgi:uncharacterized membrane protein
MIRSLSGLATIVLLAACQSPGETAPTTEAYDGIGESETVRFTGTEPFWGGEASGTQLLYSTIDDQDGTTIAVERFAGNAGIGYSGTLGGAAFDMTVTEGECSDGMSDRTYPFTVTLKIGAEQRNGCGWTDRRPYTGPANP